MKYNHDLLDEMNVLACFDLASLQTGIKVHSTAEKEKVAAVARLFKKGLVTQVDGGYLTDSGHEAAEHLLHFSGLMGIAEQNE